MTSPAPSQSTPPHGHAPTFGPRPRVLLVDDSAVALEFGRVALGGDYDIATAGDGQEGLEKAARLKPALILLDLTMPVMNGDEALAKLKSSDLSGIPVVILSSERSRADACLEHGAAAALHKPVTAATLRKTVDDVIRRTQAHRRDEGLAVLPVEVGPLKLALPLSQVLSVHSMPRLAPLPTGPGYLCELVYLGERPVAVLHLALRLGVEHQNALLDRQLIILRDGDRSLAVSVDSVSSPEEVPAESLTTSGLLDGLEGTLLPAVICLARMAHGTIPVLSPFAMLPRGAIHLLSQET